MLSQKIRNRIKVYVAILQSFADRLWYPPLIGLLAALDNLIIVIPNDGILVSSAMLTPKRWFFLATCVAIGSTIGALVLAALIENQGLPWILQLFPGVNQTMTWQITENFFQKYGLIVVFVVAASPLIQQPAVILAALAETPLVTLALVIFVGRFIKFLIMAYVASHAPSLLKRMWGLKDELKDAGVIIK